MGKIHIPMKRGTQRGAILLTSLVLLAVLTIVGAYVFSTGSLQERMAGVAQLMTLNTQASQSAADAFMASGSNVAGGSISNPANIGANIVRRTIDQSPVIPVPFTPQAANAIAFCVNNNGQTTNVATGSAAATCASVQLQNTAGAAAAIRGNAAAYYYGCGADLCGEGQATSMGGATGNWGCPMFYVESNGWLDLDGNGLPQTAPSDESPVVISQWARWKRPVKCNEL